VLPPRMAPVQVIMIPVGPPKKRQDVMGPFDRIFETLKQAGIRVKADLRDESPGWKFNEWEMRGVPLRIELGPRDVENNQCVLARRDTGEKLTVPLDKVLETVQSLLDTEIQKNLFRMALDFRDRHSHLDLETLDDLQKHIASAAERGEPAGWMLAGWCGSDACEAKVKEETKYTSRNIPFDPPAVKKRCLVCGDDARHTVWFARAY